MSQNPLVTDRELAFQLVEVHDAPALCALPYFSDHDKSTFEMTVSVAARFAREQLFPTYKAMDESPPVLRDGHLAAHPAAHKLYPKLIELGILTATRPYALGGQQLPSVVAMASQLVLMAGNAAVTGYPLLTSGAVHLVERFADPDLAAWALEPMLSGRWGGTMALTEPHAGSSLGDITTQATPVEGRRYKIRGSKIFISAGEHDLTENIVHMTLARVAGAPPGSRGVSLFAVPKRRPENGALVPNDLRASQAIHKIGWRGLPSLVIDYGDADDCAGWLVGEPNKGLSYMFEMMNAARIMVGANGVATASAAYHQSLHYALERPQGRRLADRDPTQPQRAIIEHADVRRMLLRQKAIVEGGLSLVLAAARLDDVASHGVDPAAKAEALALLGLLTPIVKTFPAEWGFESNALALQIHGGYGYSSEYLPESWLRDQKLNSIHEGTTGIQGLDLLGRKAIGDRGAALRLLGLAIHRAAAEATTQSLLGHGLDVLGSALTRAMDRLGAVTMALGMKGATGGADAMMRHSTDYLSAACIIVVGWQWLVMATAAARGLGAAPPEADAAFYRGKRAAADYWFRTELPRALSHLDLCESGEDSFARIQKDEF